MALTTGEFDLLSAFAQHPGRVLSRDFLLEQTRGREAGPFDRTIDVQIGRLRRKLEADPDNPQIIKSVRGAGYILVPSVEADAESTRRSTPAPRASTSARSFARSSPPIRMHCCWSIRRA